MAKWYSTYKELVLDLEELGLRIDHLTDLFEPVIRFEELLGEVRRSFANFELTFNELTALRKNERLTQYDSETIEMISHLVDNTLAREKFCKKVQACLERMKVIYREKRQIIFDFSKSKITFDEYLKEQGWTVFGQDQRLNACEQELVELRKLFSDILVQDH